MANDTQAQQFFNLHASGIGYLNRVRWVETGNRSGGRRAEPFLSCAINALRGSSDAPQYTYFDLKVVGEDAIQVISDLAEAVDAERKVIVAFRAADLYVHTYERRKRHGRDGQRSDETEMASLIKARLLLITSAKVDGELVYKREEPEDGNVGDVDDAGAQPGDAGDGGNADTGGSQEANPAEPPQRREPANERAQGAQGTNGQRQAGDRGHGQRDRGGERDGERRDDRHVARQHQGREQRGDTRSARYARN
ncbi:MAG: hypothetical protein DI587_14790 [Variovorax paradoxus]|nr:MAG: hypothetical protein DI583_14790 [Variovorax paradoxus]PZQ09672.1 MAG: hypothetical protein DI587_14790 [Variovorax paradoxus]